MAAALYSLTFKQPGHSNTDFLTSTPYKMVIRLWTSPGFKHLKVFSSWLEQQTIIEQSASFCIQWDLNTELVWYLNGQKEVGHQIVWFPNAI